MSNFEFLKSEWSEIYELAVDAEKNVCSSPAASCILSRKTLECAVKWLYQNDSYLKLPYDSSLNSLIHEQSFKENLDPKLFPKLKIIQKVGNIAAHSQKTISESDSLNIIQELFHFLYWLYRYYSTSEIDRNIVFNADLIPSQNKDIEQLTAMIKALQEQVFTKDELLKQANETLLRVQETKAINKQIPDNYDYNESETREYFIDVLLKEAGWNVKAKNVEEYKVYGMPNNEGVGYVDYVLWGDDGKPLALVEAKRTRKDPAIGQRQAELYANCLEQMHGQRPIIFYSNGYKHFIWDDKNYPPREVQGFYKKDELQLLIQRRTSKKSLNNIVINKEISGRPYQEEAIKRVCEDFEKKKRKCLVVMATGTGKTRTAISLVDVLQKNNWAKRVLFLADRVALLNQTKNVFKKILPNSNPVDITEDKDDTTSRVVLSTYHTMMNLIDSTKAESKVFGVGHFDLIIIDEAHRSVYKKFGAIFKYFDALTIGLTATPRNEVDKNTYELFELEEGVPTYYYELEKAVEQGYLVPPKAYSVPVKFLREDLKYKELSKDEQEEYEVLFFDEETGTVPEYINAGALNSWLFNEDTVDKVLEHLMVNGIKVEGGDRLGKTIIFAKNHEHAEYIKKRFDANYPHYNGHYARVIDNYATYTQSLINDFSVKEKEPTIAISVDMLDTGIDVPEVVNLVFFKIVRSKTKFHQMIGRGTRLCPDLFAPNQDKEHFYIFDFCQNYEYFDLHPEGIEGKNTMTLSQKIFLKRLELAQSIRNKSDELQFLSDKLKDALHSEVKSMDIDNFIVRPHRKEVEKYSDREVWNNLSPQELLEIQQKLSHLENTLPKEDELSKRFDLMVLNMQLSVLENYKGFDRYKTKIVAIAEELETKRTIPMVNVHLELIQDMQTDSYWEFITIPMLEKMRIKIRELIQFLDKNGGQRTVYIDFEDTIGQQVLLENQSYATASDSAQYKKKVEFYLKEHQDHIVIHKLKNNKPITPTDIQEIEKILFLSGELGDKEKFVKAYGENIHLGQFIRKIVGLDRKAAESVFAEYLNDKMFNANQIRFTSKIIDHLTQNGTMDPGILYEPPFTDIHCEGIEGVFRDDFVDDIIHIIREVNDNAEAFNDVRSNA